MAKHADMKQRLDQLAENNTAIVTLVKAYAPQAKTAAFSAQARIIPPYPPSVKIKSPVLGLSIFTEQGVWTTNSQERIWTHAVRP